MDPFEKMGSLVEKVGSLAEKVNPMNPMFPEPRIVAPKVALFADTTHERLVEEVETFQEALAGDEEVGAMMAHFGQQLLIQVQSITWRNPFLIVFHGTTEKGDRCTLVQHMSQLSVLLVALKAKDPKNPHRIGFRKQDEEDASDEDSR